MRKAEVVIDWPKNCNGCPILSPLGPAKCLLGGLPPTEVKEGRRISWAKNCPLRPHHELICCYKCTHWDKEDSMFMDFDDKHWHHCKRLGIDTPEYFYCSEGLE